MDVLGILLVIHDLIGYILSNPKQYKKYKKICIIKYKYIYSYVYMFM